MVNNLSFEGAIVVHATHGLVGADSSVISTGCGRMLLCSTHSSNAMHMHDSFPLTACIQNQFVYDG